MISKNEVELDIRGRKFKVFTLQDSFSEGARVFLLIRPESVELEPKKPNTLTGIVRQIIYLGSRMVYEIEIAKSPLTVEITNPQEHKIFSKGEGVTVTFKEKSLHIIPYEEIKK